MQDLDQALYLVVALASPLRSISVMSSRKSRKRSLMKISDDLEDKDLVGAVFSLFVCFVVCEFID